MGRVLATLARFIRDALRVQLGQGELCYSVGVCAQALWVRLPIDLHAGGEFGHWVGLDAYTGYAVLFGFDQRCACPAERIENAARALQEPELLQVPVDQMGWVRQDEAIPVVDGAVLGVESVVAGFRQAP